MEVVGANSLGSNAVYIRQIMSDMKNGVLALDTTGNVLYSNPQMNAFFEKENLRGQTVHSLMFENENPENDAFWDVIMEVTQGHAIHYQKRVLYTAPSGRKYSLHMISSYLAGEAEGVVITVSDETDYDLLIRKKHDATFVLVGMLLMVCLTVLVTELHEFVDGFFPHQWIARSTEVAAGVFLLLALKYTSLTVKDFGIIPRKPIKELLEALAVVGIMVGGLSIAKIVLISKGSELFAVNKPFFDFTAPPDFYYIKYIGIVFLQEVQTKCGLQKGITRILDNKHANVLAIAIISILFMALHVQHGLVFMIGAGILSAVLAVMYSRYNSLLGCSIVHYSFGIFGLVLGWIV